MDPAPQEALKQALAQAVVAQARLEIFAQKARAQKRPRLAALFAALAASAGVHVQRFTMLLRGKVADSEANLDEALHSLLPGLAQGYADAMAPAQGSPGGGALDQASRATARQQELARALAQDPESDAAYMLCPVCGWLALGQAPDNCPVCGCIAAKFVPQEAEG